jgi:hypothetical protein
MISFIKSLDLPYFKTEELIILDGCFFGIKSDELVVKNFKKIKIIDCNIVPTIHYF